jgi:hypothetical protein
MTLNPILISTQSPKIPEEGMPWMYHMRIVSKEPELQCPVPALSCNQVIGMKKDSSNYRKTMACVFSGRRFMPSEIKKLQVSKKHA